MHRLMEVLSTPRPRALELNAIPGVEPFRYESGEAVPNQELDLR